MSDHPEVPRVEFDDSGYSMNKDEAVARFRRLLDTAEVMHGWLEAAVEVESL